MIFVDRVFFVLMAIGFSESWCRWLQSVSGIGSG